jgi:hypothetical protein
MKKWYQSKTLWFNALSLVALVLQGIIEGKLVPAGLAWEALGIVVINAILRMLTNTGIGMPPSPPTQPTGSP